ncbi:MAG: hypothetical protein F9K25_20390 [Candidatus Contendobacter sp.]|nr:MAG: hypothetical protein F9K25_20390 [Candidatus Contendobacter sp.]
MSLSGIGTVRRIRELLFNAPWSNFDLMASAITFWIGAYLLATPTMFVQIGGVYASMATVAPEWVWGGLFIGLGSVGVMTVLWCQCPRFVWRLLARMGVAFCLLTFALNNLSYAPPPLSTVTYGFLSLWALWGVLRTKASGR